MKYKILIILLIISSFIFPQTNNNETNEKIDALKRTLIECKDDKSQKFQILMKIAQAYQNTNFDSSIAYGFDALRIAEQSENYEDLINSNLYISNIFLEFNETYRALEYSTKALKLASLYNDDLAMSRSFSQIVTTHLWYTHEHDVVKIYLKKWLKLAEKTNNEQMQTNVHFNLGIYFSQLNEFADSEKYYLKALEYYKKTDHKQNIANCLNNLGDLKEKEGKLDIALEFNQKALAINQEINDFHGMFINRFNIASIYSKTNKIEEFRKILDEETIRAKKLGNHYYLMLINELYYNYYSKTKNFEKALEHFKKFNQENKMLGDNQKSYRMKKLENKYLLEQASDQKKIYELNLKNKTSTLYLVTALLALLIVIFGAITYYFMKKRKMEELEIKELKTKTELLALQYKINPHFLFNSLNSISQLIIMKSDHAEDMIQNLSDLLRYTLTFANKDMVPLEDELEAVTQYLDMEKIRFQERLNYQVETKLENLNFQIPPMVILPLVENSIKHGVSKLIENGNIFIKLEIENNYLTILVKDNGPMSDNHEPVEMSKNTGFGHQSIIDRLKITYSGDYKFDLYSCDKEYCAKISIPTK